MKSVGGRPTKRSPAVEKHLLEVVKTGLPLKFASASVGISYDTLAEWRNRDPKFAEALEIARLASVEERWLKIQQAAEDTEKLRGDWKALAWCLERSHPESFARPEIQLGVAIQNNVNVNNTLVVTAEVADQLQSRSERAGAVIEKLFAARKVAQTNSTNGDDVREVEISLAADAIRLPTGEPTQSWWSQLSVGSGERLISDDAAEYVIRTIAVEVLGAQRTSGLAIELEAGDTVLRDVWSALSDLTGTLGWSALVKRGEL